MKTILLSSLLLFSSMTGCQKKLTKFQKFMEDAEKIAVFEIDQFASPVNEQDTNKEYLSDYEIFKPVDLSKPAIEELKTILGDSLSYTQDNVKACPFIGKYGIAITHKSAYIHVILSSENCPKCQIISSDQALKGDFDVVNLDLYKVLEAEIKK